MTGRIVEHLMRLVVLMARTYPPYSKWFGTAFSRLPSAGELEPHLLAAIQAPDAVGREQALSRAYAFVAHTHNRLGITAPLPEGVSPAYEGRPGLVIHANRFADALNQLVEPGQG